MRIWPKRNFTVRQLENELRSVRPKPRAAFAKTLAQRIHEDQRRPGLYRASRVAFAASMTVVMLGTFASFGGVGYAAASAREAVAAVTSLSANEGSSPAADQYKTEEQEEVAAAAAQPPQRPARAVAARTASQGNLPFTGLGLVATALAGLGLAGAGGLLRLASRKAAA